MLCAALVIELERLRVMILDNLIIKNEAENKGGSWYSGEHSRF